MQRRKRGPFSSEILWNLGTCDLRRLAEYSLFRLCKAVRVRRLWFQCQLLELSLNCSLDGDCIYSFGRSRRVQRRRKLNLCRLW